ncbi:bifunctional phosphopantothenoylcysteine decarboxylase/phosphopantothenate--cysteine ligase CoaBC [Vulcanisaeta distributa]|uniref:bifunctional phosphopantothenoylcysteine decarboxylase/phosphopantothenate--cysteine ligase CoaBC n=1 Tax=Vulcanisaeta distributa TaxID=164451 RepID=UPI0006D248F0|nr:bifunctional phosphopantothenoylcysteine decarboxylase/phosphopantothenate--cysteine ligase CoaBC [Vulcanisaeta distributa]
MPFREDVELIRGSKSRLLQGKRIALALTGGISIYRVPDIARELIRHGGADVTTFMSKEASELLGPRVMEWATGNPVYVELSGYAEHVNICTTANAVVIAPATANTISKIANGIGDTSVTLCAMTALGSGVPLLLVPAMNESMWRNPVIKTNIEKLRNLGGVRFVEPVIEEGKAKLAPNQEVVDSVIDLLSPRDMVGLSVLITSGPTHEYIDATKYITTPSSGLTGYHFAREAMARGGARVTLIEGPVGISDPPGAEIYRVKSVLEMYDVAIKLVSKRHYDLAILTAAPLDFYVKDRVSGKLSSDLDKVVIELVQAPKIARDLKKFSPSTFLIAYKAEVGITEEELINKTMRRASEGDWDLALAHLVGEGRGGFGTERDEVLVLGKDRVIRRIGPLHKRELAREVLSLYLSMIRPRAKS